MLAVRTSREIAGDDWTDLVGENELDFERVSAGGFGVATSGDGEGSGGPAEDGERPGRGDGSNGGHGCLERNFNLESERGTKK